MKQKSKYNLRIASIYVAKYSVICLSILPTFSKAAMEFGGEGLKVKITGAASYGVGFRADDRDPNLIFNKNAAVIGVATNNNTGRNGDDGNLNNSKDDIYTNVIKGFADVTITSGDTEGVIRLQAWNDLNQNYHNVLYGSIANGYKPNTPLSSSGAPERAKSENIIVSNAYISTKINSNDTAGKFSIGYQNIGWRGNSISGGAMTLLDPIDLAARNRPGAFVEETSIPIPSAKISLDINKMTNISAF